MFKQKYILKKMFKKIPKEKIFHKKYIKKYNKKMPSQIYFKNLAGIKWHFGVDMP